MLRRFGIAFLVVALGMFLALPTSLRAEDVPATQGQRRAVMEILQELKPGQTDIDVVAAKLIGMGKSYLPALEALAAHPERLVGDTELNDDRAALVDGSVVVDMGGRENRIREFRQYRIQALEMAITFLSLGFDPAGVIAEDLARRSGSPNAAFPKATLVADESIRAVLPDVVAYAIVVRQFPVARIAPPPLQNNNLFFVNRKDKTVTQITDIEGLKTYALANFAAVQNQAAAKAEARAWLALAEGLANDGMFQFTIPDEQLQAAAGDAGMSASGKALVDRRGGNSGQIAATLSFDRDGKLTAVQQEAKLKPGIRPVCQATKLLDRDPIIRKMAEQDILIMGSPCFDYLAEQRAKASPELQRAIDAMTKRVLEREAN